MKKKTELEHKNCV